MPDHDTRRLLETIRDQSYALHVRAIVAIVRLDHGYTAPPKQTVDRLVSEVARAEWMQQVAESMLATSKAEEIRLSRRDRFRVWWAALWLR